MKTVSPFLALPPELRFQIYEYLHPVPPEPPQCIEQYSSGPERNVKGRSWSSLLCLCKQIRDEAEEEFYRRQKIKIGFYAISKDAFFFPRSPYCRTRIHFLGQYRDEDSLNDKSCISSLLKVKNLEVDIFVTGDGQCLEHLWHLQDCLYELVIGLSDAQASIKNLHINLSIINLISLRLKPVFAETSDWRSFTERWPEIWEHAVFLLEPFLFLRRLDSGKLGNFSVLHFLDTTLATVRGPWPDTGPQGEFKKRMEKVMTKSEPATGLWEVQDFYGCASRLLRVCEDDGNWHRACGDVDKLSKIAWDMLAPRPPTGSIDMKDWANNFEEWMDFERAAEKCAGYFAVPLYRELCARKTE